MACPNDDGHRVPKDRLEKHVPDCNLLKRGYSREEVVSGPIFPISLACPIFPYIFPKLPY